MIATIVTTTYIVALLIENMSINITTVTQQYAYTSNLSDCSWVKWPAELSKPRILAIPSLPSWLTATKPLYQYHTNIIYTHLHLRIIQQSVSKSRQIHRALINKTVSTQTDSKWLVFFMKRTGSRSQFWNNGHKNSIICCLFLLHKIKAPHPQ